MRLRRQSGFCKRQTIVAPLNDGNEIERGNVVARWTEQGTDRHAGRGSALRGQAKGSASLPGRGFKSAAEARAIPRSPNARSSP